MGSKAAPPREPQGRLKGKGLTDAVADLINRGGAAQDLREEDEGEHGESEGEGSPGGDGFEGFEDPGQQQGDAGAQDEGGDVGEHESLEDVARALKLKPEEFNKLEVSIRGQRVTLGDLKAGYHKVLQFEQKSAEFEERATATELEQIDAHRQLMAIIDSFPAGSLPPAVLHRVSQQRAQNQREQAALLTKARPSWGDPKYVEAERGPMMALGKKYGFSAAELGAVSDHRQILLLQDFAHALARIDAAKGAARRVDPVGNKPLSQEGPRAAVSGRAAQAGTTNKSQLARRIQDLIAKG